MAIRTTVDIPNPLHETLGADGRVVLVVELRTQGRLKGRLQPKRLAPQIGKE